MKPFSILAPNYKNSEGNCFQIMKYERHFTVIAPYQRKLTIQYQGKNIVESQEALILKEIGKTVIDLVLYIPKKDIKVNMEKEEDETTYCPIKGWATYWKIKDQKNRKILPGVTKILYPRKKR